MGHTGTHTMRQAPPGAVAPESPGRGPAALRGPSTGAHELQVQVSSAVLRIVTQAETSGHTPPPEVHTCSQVGDSSTRTPPM